MDNMPSSLKEAFKKSAEASFQKPLSSKELYDELSSYISTCCSAVFTPSEVTVTEGGTPSSFNVTVTYRSDVLFPDTPCESLGFHTIVIS